MTNLNTFLVAVIGISIGACAGQVGTNEQALDSISETDEVVTEDGAADRSSLETATASQSGNGAAASRNRTPANETAQLIFESNFDGSLKLSVKDNRIWTLSGKDVSRSNSSDWGNVGRTGFFEKGGPRNEPDHLVDYALVPDPKESKNTVIRLHSIDDDRAKKGTTRAQVTFTYRDDIGPVLSSFIRMRWFIDPTFKQLANMKNSDGEDKHGWTDFFEIWWNNLPFCPGADTCNPAGSFRANFKFAEIDDTKEFEWIAHVEDMEGPKEERSKDRYHNPDVPVWFGRWIEVQVLIVEGENPKVNPESPARFAVAMRPEGSSKWRIVFDIRDVQLKPKEGVNGIKSLHPLKNYMQDSNLDFMRGGKRRAFMYYDDLQIWDHCPLDSFCAPG